MDHPHVFRYEGKLWVSELPAAEAREQLVAQRAWDARNAKLQRWWVAIVIGAALGVIATLGLGTVAGLFPALYLVLLPVGFGIGAVVGALVNKRFNPDAAHGSLPPRPRTVELVTVPRSVARRIDHETPVSEIIALSRPGKR